LYWWLVLKNCLSPVDSLECRHQGGGRHTPDTAGHIRHTSIIIHAVHRHISLAGQGDLNDRRARQYRVLAQPLRLRMLLPPANWYALPATAMTSARRRTIRTARCAPSKHGWRQARAMI
jgi:hypothetical protein